MVQQGVYRHYKGGLYTVLMAARCSDNGPREGDDVVIYVSHTTGQVCTRFAREFFGKVGGDGYDANDNRFEFVAHSVVKR